MKRSELLVLGQKCELQSTGEGWAATFGARCNNLVKP